MTFSRKIILYVLYFIFVVAFGIGILLAFTHNSGKKTVAKVPTSSQKATTTKNAPPIASNSPAASTTGKATATAGASAHAALNDSTSHPQLVNTGPGSTVAIFILATGVGIIGYHSLQIRRLR